MEAPVFAFAQQKAAEENVLSEKPRNHENTAMSGFSQLPSFGSASLDLLAKNLNLNTWEGYSSLSKIMFSLEADMKSNGEPQRILSKQRAKPDGSKINGSLTGSQHASQSAQISLSLSSLVSNMKELSPETAAFLQENDTELNGDASLLRSLSRVSLGDFIEDGDAKLEPDENDVRVAVTSLTAVVVDESKGAVTENAVASIAAVNFQHCGYPAFDKSNELVGFYFLTETTNTPELRFLPNFYPLPPPMVRELQTSCEKWQSEHGVIYNRQGSDALSLESLKLSVIQAILRRQA
ncbi:hypothetical protein PINS_up002072 [Pythium insidiosum]|nr:hypothetical protein PINS_up002072 [Pythium insidiosum]